MYEESIQALTFCRYIDCIWGNAILGVQAGVAAGILTVAVNTGPLEEQQLLAAGAAVVFSDMTVWTNYFDKFVDDLSVI